jgi:hypothetical protein
MLTQQQISIKAIVLGVFIDLGLSIIFTLVVGFIYVTHAVKEGVSLAHVQDVILSSDSFFVVCLIGGFVIVTICGFITARLSKQAELLNAAVFGFVGIVLGAIMVLLEERSYPLWFNLTSFLLIVPCAVLGGYLSQRMRSGTAA